MYFGETLFRMREIDPCHINTEMLKKYYWEIYLKDNP